MNLTNRRSYICSHCGAPVEPKLVDDGQGQHGYKFCCQNCHREFGLEWTVFHHSCLGESEPAPALTLRREGAESSEDPAALRNPPLDDGFLEAIECWKKRAFHVFSLSSVTVAMVICLIVEIGAIKKLWGVFF